MIIVLQEYLLREAMRFLVVGYWNHRSCGHGADFAALQRVKQNTHMPPIETDSMRDIIY